MKYSIGIDIGGTNTVFGLVSEKGNIKAINKISTKGYKSFDDYLDEIVDNVIKFYKEVSNTTVEIIGVGIGAPNGNYYKGVIDNAPNLEFKGVLEVRHLLEVKLSQKGYCINVALTNDANAAAMGEMIYGKGKGVKKFYYDNSWNRSRKWHRCRWKTCLWKHGVRRRNRTYNNRRTGKTM